jgi:hypothetical protein
MHPHSLLGEPDSKYSNLAIWMRQAAKHGLVSSGTLPKEFVE